MLNLIQFLISGMKILSVSEWGFNRERDRERERERDRER